MELGLVRKVDIDEEMQQSYLDYAMSVIVSRALPDARDGLKPVQRRILYAMYDMGLRPESTYKKSARIVGEVLGKYHPHGDMAVYEAMARLAQDFSMRYPLVDGQGNFGSIDGDPPAAMRYTEARLASPALSMLVEFEKNTVNFTGNFDDSLKEPVVLPAAIPNLLVNGATGIAVGMATNVPPHNLGEVVDASIFMLERWDKLDDIPIDALMKFVQGPDFPTGGVLLQDPQGEGLAGAYATGRGRVILQARVHLEDMERGRSRIIVSELPYMVNKSNLIERIAELVRGGDLEGVADLRDESDRQGMRIVIDLTKTAEPEKILRILYHRTPMQTTFSIALLALVKGEPHWLSLKQALKVYLEHRLEVIQRRSAYDLEKARQRAHILEGFRIAINNLDEIIQLIRNSADVDQARKRLISRFKLSDIQATAILDMPLRRLAALERKKIEAEYKEVSELIKNLEALLHSPKKIRQVAIDELLAVKASYEDRRRTQIVKLKEGESIASMLTTTDVTPAETALIGVSKTGLVCRLPDRALDASPQTLAPYWLVRASTHHTLYLAAASGKAAAIPVHSIPEKENLAEGVPFYKVSPLADNEAFACCFAAAPKNDQPENEFILTVSENGMVKKSAVSDLPGSSAQPFVLTRINEGDQLIAAVVTHGDDELLVATRGGMAIRFSENDVRPMGLNAAGVGAIKLSAEDLVVDGSVVNAEETVFLLSSDGKAKRIPPAEFPTQSRYGQGVSAWKMGKGAYLSAVFSTKPSQRAVVHFEQADPVVISMGDAPLLTRAKQGKQVVEVPAGDEVIGALLIAGTGGAKPKPTVPPPSMLEPESGKAGKAAAPEKKKRTSPAQQISKSAVENVKQPASKENTGTAEAKTRRTAASKQTAPLPSVNPGAEKAKAEKPKRKPAEGSTVQPEKPTKSKKTVKASAVAPEKTAAPRRGEKSKAAAADKLAAPEKPGKVKAAQPGITVPSEKPAKVKAGTPVKEVSPEKHDKGKVPKAAKISTPQQPAVRHAKPAVQAELPLGAGAAQIPDAVNTPAKARKSGAQPAPAAKGSAPKAERKPAGQTSPPVRKASIQDQKAEKKVKKKPTEK